MRIKIQGKDIGRFREPRQKTKDERQKTKDKRLKTGIIKV